jgi:head-tail adaptor
MTSKNPFEIRLEVLKMAKEMMDTSYSDSMNGWWSLVNSYAEAQNKSVEEFIKQSAEMMNTKPTMYTPEEMMKKAQELYSFVSRKE